MEDPRAKTKSGNMLQSDNYIVDSGDELRTAYDYKVERRLICVVELKQGNEERNGDSECWSFVGRRVE